MKKIFNIVLVIMVLIPSFVLKIDNVKAQTFGELKQEYEKFKKDYEENEKKSKLTEQQISETKVNIVNLSEEIENTNKEIIDLQLEIEKLNEEIKRKDSQIKQLVSFTQISNGNSAYLEYIFGASDFTDFIYRMAVAEQLADYNSKLIDEYNAKIEENNKKTKELDDKIQLLNKKQDDLEKLLIQLNKTKNEIAEEGHTITEELKMREEAIALYEEMGCKDDENINYCGNNALPSNTELFRPTEAGGITSPYGSRINPISGAKSFHYGLDLGWYFKAGGDPIYSAGNGVVVWVGHKDCGNNIVYIHHRLINGETYTTSYWHMRKVYVKVGDVVSKETQIGIMGGSRSEDTCSTGPHLHFMVARGLYLIDYTSYNSHTIDPRKIINFPSSGKWKNRYQKYN